MIEHHMKLSHRILSTTLTFAVKNAVRIPVILLLLVLLLLILRSPSIIHTSVSIAVAAVLISIILLRTKIKRLLVQVAFSNNDEIESESSRAKKSDYANKFYEIDSMKFQPRNIEPGGVRYANGSWFSANDGRKIRFRGINLPAKTPSYPVNLRNTNSKEGFLESKNTVSFIDRPFPLKDAPGHFQRLSNYGYNLIRLTCTWEAVMHEAPGVIDEAYLDYLNKLVDIADEFGLYVLIDPHQDVWSRFTGGDGAPIWTLDVAGFKTDDFSLHDTGCALLHQCQSHDEAEYDTPRMLWPTNYFKLVTATMFTLFFAGDEYAKGQTVDGTDETFQQFLQRHYLSYLDAIAESLKEKVNVIGFGTMNEPNAGFVGLSNLNKSLSPAPYGHVLSGFDCMRLGSGEAVSSEYYSTPFIYDHTETLNLEHKSVWKHVDADVWKKAGVYGVDKKDRRVLLRPGHFELEGNDDFITKFMEPFFVSVQKTVAKHNAKFITFAEPHLDPSDPFVQAPSDLDSNEFAWAPHFYDFLMLIMKAFHRWLAVDIDSELIVISPLLIDWAFRRNLKRMVESGRGMHVLLGETGIPFDMAPGTDVNAALNRTLKAMEANDLDYTLWCYYPHNSDEDGDEWNGENLSIRTRHGNRGLLSAVRPFAVKYSTHVDNLSQSFDPFSQRYKLELKTNHFSSSSEEDHITVDIFVPSCHYVSPMFSATSGDLTYDKKIQTLIWKLRFHQKSKLTHCLEIINET